MKTYIDRLLSINIIPMNDIIINIFQLLRHSPVCQHALRFSRLRNAGIAVRIRVLK